MPGVLVGDALGVTDQQDPDPPPDDEGHLLGGLVMRLVDAAVTGLNLPARARCGTSGASRAARGLGARRATLARRARWSWRWR